MSFGFGRDPFDIGLHGLGLGGRAAPPEWRRPLPAAESESFVKDLAGRGASGLGYVASALDKPGRAVRGLLGGKPREALAAIPFSDSLGITNPDDAVSGRKLLDSANVTSRTDKGWGAWGLGLAAEMALDPLTYATFGANNAVTPTGRALANQGLTRGMSRRQLLAGFNDTESAMKAAGQPAHVIEHAFDAKLPVATAKMEAAASAAKAPIKDTPLGGLVGLGLPFRDPSVVLGTGATAQKVAGGIDKAADFLRHGNPVGRYLGAHFDPSVGGATTAAMQRGFREAGRPTQEAAKRQAARQYFDATAGVNDLLSAGHPEADVVSALNLAREGLPMTGVDPAVAAQATPVGQMMKSYGEDQMRQSRAVGAPTDRLNDKYVDYGPRVATTIERHGLNAKGARSDTIAPVKTASDVHRKSAFRDVPGGAEMINRLAMDFAGDDPAAFTGDVLQRLTDAHLDAGRPLGPDEIKHLTDKSGEVAGVIASMSPKYKTDKIPYFSPNLPHAVELRGARHAKSVAAAEATTSALANMARPAAELGADGVSLREALRRAKLKTKLPKGGTAEGAAVRILKKLAPKGQGPLDPADMASADKIRGLLDGWAVPSHELEPLISQWDKMRAPTNAVQPIRVLDSATNAFKNLAYTTWLSSHVRNLGSAAQSNVMGLGSTPADMALAFKTMRNTATAADIARIPGAPAFPDDASARRWLKGQAFENAGVFAGHNSATDLAGTGQELVDNLTAGNRITPTVPGDGRTGTTGNFAGDLLGLAREGLLGKKGETSPLNVLGQAGLYDKATGALKSKDTFSPLAAGRTVGTNVEDFSRLAGYIGGVRGGMAPDVAGRTVNKYHFDYGDLTDFEKKVMRRAVPFYCVPADHEILTQQGWKTYDQLDIGEPVMSMDHATGDMEWVPLEDVSVFDFDGDLCKIERSNGRTVPTKFLFTEDHRWPVVTSKSFSKGKWYGGDRKIVRSYELKSTHSIPLTGNYTGKGTESLFSPRLAAILGWIVTDGYFRWRGGHCEMLIYQSPSKFLQEIVELTGSPSRAPHPDTGVCAVPVKIEDVQAITKYFLDKADLPEIVGSLDRPAADAMWDAMFKAEGWETAAGQQGFSQDAGYRDNSHVLDAFQILCLMTGRAANLNPRGCYVRRDKALFPMANKAGGIGREHYKGKIWCPKTKYGTWVMRHDGSTIITGNTFMSRNLPLQLEHAITRPSFLTAQLRPLDQMRGGYTPDWISSGAAIPMGENPENGTNRYVSQLGLPIEEAFERLKFRDGKPDVLGTAMAYAAGLNPYVKGPLEALSGKQFFSGRNLEDLRPSSAGSLGGALSDDNAGLLTQVISNSPATRFATSLDRALDDRKSLPVKLLNMLTGVRVTDVDMEKTMAVEARDSLERILRGRPGIAKHTNFYVRPGEGQNLTGDEVRMMRMYAEMQARARDYSEKKRQAQR